MPATNASPRGSIPAGPSPPESRLRWPSHMERWRWTPLPVSASTRGANDVTHPCRWATARTVCRTIIAASAAPTGSRGAMDTSNCPSAYSGWNCCTPNPCASIVVIRSSVKAWLATSAMSLYPGPVWAGSNDPSSRRRPIENSNSNAARTDRSRVPNPLAMRLANARGQPANGSPSCVYWSTGAHAHPGIAASGTTAAGSGRSRRSPLGPSMNPARRANWSFDMAALKSVESPTPCSATWGKRSTGIVLTRTIAEGSTNGSATTETPASRSHRATPAASAGRDASASAIARLAASAHPSTTHRPTHHLVHRVNLRDARSPRVTQQDDDLRRDDLREREDAQQGVEWRRGIHVGDQHVARVLGGRREPRVREHDDLRTAGGRDLRGRDRVLLVAAEVERAQHVPARDLHRVEDPASRFLAHDGAAGAEHPQLQRQVRRGELAEPSADEPKVPLRVAQQRDDLRQILLERARRERRLERPCERIVALPQDVVIADARPGHVEGRQPFRTRLDLFAERALEVGIPLEADLANESQDRGT